MDTTANDIIATLKIFLASVEKQRQGEISDAVRQYLDGYEAACRLLLDNLEKRKAM
jgi:hypothetical protein